MDTCFSQEYQMQSNYLLKVYSCYYLTVYEIFCRQKKKIFIQKGLLFEMNLSRDPRNEIYTGGPRLIWTNNTKHKCSNRLNKHADWHKTILRTRDKLQFRFKCARIKHDPFVMAFWSCGWSRLSDVKPGNKLCTIVLTWTPGLKKVISDENEYRWLTLKHG